MNLNITSCIPLSGFIIFISQSLEGDKMIKNVGVFDKNLRLIGGGIIVILGIVFQSWWGLVGLIPISTGLMRTCPVYWPFKISTNKKEAETK
jgi:hypothetical protein